MKRHALVFDADVSDAEERADRVQRAIDALELPVRAQALASRNSLLSRVAELLDRGDAVTCLVDLSVGDAGADRPGDRIVATLASHERLSATLRVAWTRHAGHDVIRQILAAGAHAVIAHRELREVADDDPGWRAVLSPSDTVLRRAVGAYPWLPDSVDGRRDNAAHLRDIYTQAFADGTQGPPRDADSDPAWSDWMLPALLHIAAGRRDADILADPLIDIGRLASGHRGARVGHLRNRLRSLGPGLDNGEGAARRLLYRAEMLGGAPEPIGARVELDGRIDDWHGQRDPIRIAAWLTGEEARLLELVAERKADLEDSHRTAGHRNRPGFFVAACADVAIVCGLHSTDVRLAVDRALQKLRDARADYVCAPHGTVAAVIRAVEADPHVQAHVAELPDKHQLVATPMPVTYRIGTGICVDGRSSAGWDVNEAVTKKPALVTHAIQAVLAAWGVMSDRSQR